MVYLIVKTYGAQGGEFYAAPAGLKRPAAFETLDTLAENLKREQRLQDAFKAANPRTNGAARLTVVAAEKVPEHVETYKGKEPTRALTGHEKERIRQLVPGFKL